MARTALLDAIEARQAQIDALVVVGAQAVYLHTGSALVAIAEFTTDADLAVDPDLLSSDPLVDEAMLAAGSEPDLRASVVGTWISTPGSGRPDGARGGRGSEVTGGPVATARPELDATSTWPRSRTRR